MSFMTYDWFKADIDANEPMMDSAMAFLEAGGVLSWGDWARMDPDSRSVFRAAGEAVAARRAAQAGLAAQGRAEAARVMAPADGGDAIVRLAIVAAMNNAEEVLK